MLTLEDCIVSAGEIPKDLNGGFYRVGPTWRRPSKQGCDTAFAMDGMVQGLMLHDGRARRCMTPPRARRGPARRSGCPESRLEARCGCGLAPAGPLLERVEGRANDALPASNSVRSPAEIDDGDGTLRRRRARRRLGRCLDSAHDHPLSSSADAGAARAARRAESRLKLTVVPNSGKADTGRAKIRPKDSRSCADG